MGDRLFDAPLAGAQTAQGAVRGREVAAGKAGGERRSVVGFGPTGPGQRIVAFPAPEVEDGPTRFQGDGGVVLF